MRLTREEVEAKVKYAGRVVQRQAEPLVNEVWVHPGNPSLIVCAKENVQMYGVGRIAAVLNREVPREASWMIFRHDDFREESGAVPFITDKASWRADKKGLSTQDTEQIFVFELQKIKEEMSLLTPPNVQ